MVPQLLVQTDRWRLEERGGAAGPETSAAHPSVAELLKDAAALAVAHVSPAAAMQWAVDLVCTHVGWTLGHVLTLADDAEVLRSSGIWYDDRPAEHAPFHEATAAARFAAGDGLAGRVLEVGDALWLTDIADHTDNFPRRPAALRSGLRTGFAFPIRTERGVEGVIEVYNAERAESDPDLLALAAYVGLQVGRVFDRDRAGRQLRDAERLAQLGPWSWDVASDILNCTPELYLMHGIEPRKRPDGELIADPVPRKAWIKVLHPDDQPAMLAFSERVVATGEGGELEYRVQRGRSLRWVRLYAEVAERRGDEVLRVAGYSQDVTGRRRTEDRRRRAQRELTHQQRVLERIARGEPVTETLTHLCRHVERRLAGTHCSVLLLDRAEGVLRHGAAPSLPTGFQEAIDGLPVGEGIGACGTAAARGETVIVTDSMSDPLTAPFRELASRFDLHAVWSHPLRKAGGEVLGTFAVYRRVPHKPSRSEIRLVTTMGSLAALAIERHHAEAALQTAANFDGLTGLLNRARFLELVNEHLQVADRKLALMLLELDRFHQINESLGHLAGDRILVEVADRLRHTLGWGGLIARFSGDVFTVAVPGADAHEIGALADRAVEAIERPLVLDGGEFFLTASIGIAHNAHPTDAYGLVRDADAAMNAARAQGPGQRQIYDRRLRARTIERLNQETELRRGIERGELTLHYQPILDLGTRRWSGAEALVRWRHPKRGLLGPDEFIPLAEETGLIVPLGQSVLQMVTDQAARWGRRLPGIHIAYNASPLQLADPTIAADLIDLLERAGVPPEALRLEVTESALMEELETTRQALEELMAAGVRVLIDDFGTGYSSIARLGELPITGLKIDRRFTSGLGVDASVRPVLRAIAELARAYDLQMVAEGIEDSRALHDVDELGCQFAQGYLLGRPGPPASIERLLKGPPPVA